MTGMENTMIWDFVWRLVLAALFGTIIGLDREYREKEAGFRTHFLVSLGSALMMIVSQYGFSEILTHDGVSLDPSRIAAQVVSGIGGCPAYGRVKCSCKAFAESSLPMREPFSTHPVRWSMKVAP